MWDETYVETRLESQLDNLDISLHSFKKKDDTFWIVCIIILSTAVIIASVKLKILGAWLLFLQSTPFLRSAFYALAFFTFVVIMGIIFRTILWIYYKPIAISGCEPKEWPSVSVIMPAFNEEELIEDSIDSIFSSIYPKEKLEVICINDGSMDSTPYHMMNAKLRYGEKIKIINFSRNVGKRKALYSAMKKAKGEIIITADTDSKIDREALRNLVLPLIKDKQTAAVAGRVEVLNEKDNFLTRMLAVRYSLSFNFGRAYQSVYGSVFCCPGALSAYRKNVLKRFYRQWAAQKFLNAFCSYGEDRALTTNILKEGYRTRYQSNAVVRTKVPTTLGGMSRMYLRWTRSYIRESIIFAGFMFTRYRDKHRLLPILDFFFLNFLHPFHIFALVFIGYSFYVNPLFLLRYIAVLVIFSFFLSLYYLRAKRSLTFLYGIPYAIITAFCLWWIVPFAAFTLKNPSWMTR